MNEFHIYDTATDGNRIHARQIDDEIGWTIEVTGDPKAARQLVASGAEPIESPYADSALYQATTEQLIGFLAQVSGYRCKLAKKVKRQYSPEHRAALAERLRKIHPLRNAILT